MKRVKIITIAFAFVLVLIAASAQPVAAASRADTLNSYISGRYDAQRGGYSPPSDNVVRVDATYGAVLALNELKSLDARPPPINLTKALDSLIVRQWLTDSQENELDRKRYGGFSEYLVGPVTMEMTFMGMKLHQLLKAQSDYPGINTKDINVTALLVYLNRTQSTNGGFSSIPDNDPDIISTYQALAIFEMLDDTYTTMNVWDRLLNETATLEWINNCRKGDAFMLSPEAFTPSVTATAAGIMALSIFQQVLTIPGIQDTNEWILERQLLSPESNDFIGGFEEGNGTEDANFATTYYALNVLEQTGAISSVNKTAVIDFILNCQAVDGSWGNIPGMEEGTLVHSGQACELLNILDSDGAAVILASSQDPNTPSGFYMDWRFFVVGGILLVALVLAIVSIRMD
ncbi:MAG: hypothetical protein OEV85_01365 [Candidatus Thorarchaeota archaeon]|nr:hypothetical protein [Candidatus Thorarchaeota archaeon]